MTLKKYFLAIVIPPPLLGEIEALKQALHEQHGLNGALRSPAHITLHRPFEWREEKEEDLIEKISGFKPLVSTNIVLKDFAFFEPRVIYVDVLPNEQLSQLHTELTTFAKRELKLFNEAEDLRGFHPHITIAFRDLKKPKFYELRSEFENKHLGGCFAYQGFSLLKLEKKWEEVRFFAE